MRKYFRKCTAGIMATVVILTGCGNKGGFNRMEEDTYKSLTQVEEPESIGYEDWEARWNIREENPVSEKFVGAVNDFSYRSAALYGQ